ncbi:uncharacterized protein LOC132755757 [Ruditapes philippinarum]|uniref:uncharacterized protein LOC132755757 n=1 Tax=Ruditapes philippinarum TaxID=129788 RepID=UPI00295BE0B3|nr:uncharacterized protein LOC132755757 [Ruditapes philippinarum]
MYMQVTHLACFVLILALDVKGEIRQKDFVVLQSRKVTNVQSTVFSRSRLFCAKSCLNAGNCTSASYNSSNNECLFSTDGLIDIINVNDNNMATILMKGTSSANGNQFGKTFFTGFMSNSRNTPGTPKLVIISANLSQVLTNVLVTIPYLGIYQEPHMFGESLHLQYSSSLMPALTSNVSFKGVEIVSDQPIALYSINHRSLSVDGTLELPKEEWGLLYIVGTHNSSLWGTGQILVIAADDNTDVLLEFPTGPSLTVALNKHETYQFQANELEPIAGTIVSANNPVVVHAGHACANIPNHDAVFCDFIMENMPPLNTLGSVFVVPYQRTRTMYTIGIAAPHDATTVDIWDVNGYPLETIVMNRQDSTFRSFYASEILSITSSQNILVTQYGHGSSNIYGDPSLTIIPALTQFTNRCNFEIPTFFIDPSVVSIVIDSASDVSGLKLNGSAIVAAASTSVIIPGVGSFNVIYIDVIGNVTYSLIHDVTHVRFGAILFARTAESEFTTVLGYGL